MDKKVLLTSTKGRDNIRKHYKKEQTIKKNMCP